jgi:phosphatidylserine/phosphatidylglycerophosphate/cardiolipin synthase-like enzyme
MVREWQSYQNEGDVSGDRGMNVLVPLSKIRVCYEAGHGRPYSHIERLVLRAIDEGAVTIDELKSDFQIHPRLLIEAVVTLTQAGWIAVSATPGESFVLSRQGKNDLSAAQDCPSSLQVRRGETKLLMERISGQFISEEDICYLSNRDIPRDENPLKLSPHVSDLGVDASRVQGFVPRFHGEWIRWVGPVETMSRDFHWLPVEVEVNSATCTGLPDEWAPFLTDPILSWAAGHSEDAEKKFKPTRMFKPIRSRNNGGGGPEINNSNVDVEVKKDDILLDTVSHEQYLLHVLANAKSQVFIASAFLSRTRVTSFWNAAKTAIERGVTIHLLWGYDADKETLNWLGAESVKLKQARHGNRLKFNRHQSNSHAKLIIWDNPAGQFIACIGSCNWLSFSESPTKEISVCVSHPVIVSQLCRGASGLWEATGDVMSSVPAFWQRIASQLDEMGLDYKEENPNAKAVLIFDQEHDFALRRWMKHAQRRLLISTHQLGPVASTRIVAIEGRQRELGFTLSVLYGTSELGGEQIRELGLSVQSAGGKLLKANNLHAKVVVFDDSVCISSYNFLSADPQQTAEGGREVGIVIQGPPAEIVTSYLRSKI